MTVDSVYGAVIMAEPLREFTRLIEANALPLSQTASPMPHAIFAIFFNFARILHAGQILMKFWARRLVTTTNR